MRETYKLIEALRKTQAKYYNDNNLQGSFWCVDIIVREMDSNFEFPLKKVIDEDAGYTRVKW